MPVFVRPLLASAAIVGLIVVVGTAAGFLRAESSRAPDGREVAAEAVFSPEIRDYGDVVSDETIFDLPESPPVGLERSAVVILEPIGSLATRYTTADVGDLLREQDVLGFLDMGVVGGLGRVKTIESRRALVTDLVYRPTGADPGQAGPPVIEGRPSIVAVIRDVPWQGVPTVPSGDAEKSAAPFDAARLNSDIVAAFDAIDGSLLFVRTVAHQ